MKRVKLPLDHLAELWPQGVARGAAWRVASSGVGFGEPGAGVADSRASAVRLFLEYAFEINVNIR